MKAKQKDTSCAGVAASDVAYPIHDPCARNRTLPDDSELGRRIETVLSSKAVSSLRVMFDRMELTIEETPILYKYLPGPFLRLIFPVTEAPVEEGAIVAVVSLYDVKRERTLYAHPMHAGPDVNPLVKYLDGPMAAPKAQEGANGERATRRLIEHKRALWQKFCEERSTSGLPMASRKWKAGYFWALRRLYFCAKCPPCRWGCPHFDGPESTVAASAGSTMTTVWPVSPLTERDAQIVADVCRSDVWKIEVDYARRGNFSVGTTPTLLQGLEDDYVQLVFPTDVETLQGGSLVALSTIYHEPTRRAIYAHCLIAGPEPEILFHRGDAVLGLPRPRSRLGGERTGRAYCQWRQDAWTRFWLDDLVLGPAEASSRWLNSFWPALAQLFGGNRLLAAA